jgi:hypothetical protein
MGRFLSFKSSYTFVILELDFLSKMKNIGYDGYMEVKEVKLIVLADLEILLLSIISFHANENDSTLSYLHSNISRSRDLKGNF